MEVHAGDQAPTAAGPSYHADNVELGEQGNAIADAERGSTAEYVEGVRPKGRSHIDKRAGSVEQDVAAGTNGDAGLAASANKEGGARKHTPAGLESEDEVVALD